MRFGYSPSSGAVFGDAGRFDAWTLAWQSTGERPGDLEPVEPLDAVKRLTASGRLRRVPVAVIGPRQASAAQVATAEELGRRLGEAGLTLLCGGKIGVMEAVCRGHSGAGGLSIGLLPDGEWEAANAFVDIPIATGLGAARNAVIGRAALALIAVGGGYGTISEMAFGLHFDRLVLGLEDAPDMPGAIRCASPEEAVGHVARRIFGLDREGETRDGQWTLASS